jgi:hypothetical protein
MNLTVTLFGIAAFFILMVMIGRSGARTPQEFFKKRGKKVGGALLVGAGAVLAFRGRFELGVPLAGIGWFLVTGAQLPNLHPLSWLPGKLMGGSKTISGDPLTVQSGPYAGKMLDGLSPPDLLRLGSLVAAADPQALAVLEKYLDGRFAGWREDLQANPERWGLGRGGQSSSLAMAENEAYEILGLAPGAGPEAITEAHRNLIKRLHPDQGGSTYLAARVNEAKAVLMKRHR